LTPRTVAAITILRAEALLQQVRSTTLPRLGGTITSTTLDRGRSLGEQTVTPRQQAAVVVSASRAGGGAGLRGRRGAEARGGGE